MLVNTIVNVCRQRGIDVKTYSQGGTKSTAVYDAASNC